MNNSSSPIAAKQASSLSPDRLPELDALRGLAAIMVVFFHYSLKRPEAAYGLKLGTTGVDLFFMISGFVIYMSLEKVKSGSRFLLNRAIRLYPTYWICVTFTFLLSFVHSLYMTGSLEEVSFAQYLANLTMFQFYFDYPDLDGPYWTMRIEMLFYLCIFLAFTSKRQKYLEVIGATLSLCVVILVYTLPPTSWWTNKGLEQLALLPHVPMFLAGILFYKGYSARNFQFSKWLLLLFCLVCQVLLFFQAGRSSMFINQTEYACMLCCFFGLFFLLISRKAGFLVNPVTLFSGRISFSLYLVHQYLSLNCIVPYLTRKWAVGHWTAALLVALPASLLVAIVITLYLEEPLLKRIRHRLKTHSPVQ